MKIIMELLLAVDVAPAKATGTKLACEVVVVATGLVGRPANN
jgi:hypothetical protein